MTKPRIEEAPGLIFRPHPTGWEARWQARTDLVEAGFKPKSQRLWTGAEPSPKDIAYIQDNCRRLQDEMLYFGRTRGELQKPMHVFDGTLRSLTSCYQTDPDSTYAKKRYAVRVNHDSMLRRMMAKHGEVELTEIKGRLLLAWHKDWSDDGQKLAAGHMFIGLLRTLFGFGATILEDPECERLCGVLHKMRFAAPKPRTEVLTAEMAQAVIMKAHEFGWHSIALAQAFQFDMMLRQKDVIGEWVPLNEPGVSEVIYPRKGKWISGLVWSSINDNLILKHMTSKRQKPVEIDLKLAPMVMEVLRFLGGRKTTGPIIICETTGRPYATPEFRRKWRIVAEAAEVPKNVRNMDSRAGAITEASESGAELEHIKHAATHSDISMTQRYARGQAEKTATVMKFRIAHRNKPKT